VKFGNWLIKGTPLDQPYPCTCTGRCSAAWCSCAGRPDPQGLYCCANWNGPAEHMAAMAAWRAEKLRRESQA
jgi:hypothetical protein